MFTFTVANATKQPAKASVKLSAPLAGVTNAAIIALAAAQAKAMTSAAAKKTTGGGSAKTSGSTAPSATAKTDTLIQWHDVEFYANARQVNGFSEFYISSSIETEDKESGGTKYVSKKNSKGYEAGLKAYFDKRLGVSDVKAAAMKLIEYGANGQTGYLYAQGKKLVSSSLMMTSAKAENVVMTPKGAWISCEVVITMKTCSKLDGSTGDTTGSGTSSSTGTSMGYKYSVRVYYSAGSGATQSVVGYSNKSVEEARKNAWAKVPKNAQWASETPNQTPKKAAETSLVAVALGKTNAATQQTEAAKTESSKIGITNRSNAVNNKVKSMMK